MASLLDTKDSNATVPGADKAPVSRRELVALTTVLALSAFLNLWNLGANGWANAYYSAAVQSGLNNIEALVFGSSDWGNSISVDKPPLSLWLIGLSVRIFGFNSWGILLPQALLGMGSVALVYAAGRRYLSPTAGLVGALILATTPVAVLLSRYSNPDALMVFLMLSSFTLTLRARESASVRRAILAGSVLSLAVLTKQLQALLVGPPIAVILLSTWRPAFRRTLQLVVAFVVPLVVVAGSWFAIVSLVPASERPYLGSTLSNNPLELTFGFNGFQRITGISDPGAALIPSSYGKVETDAGPLRLLNANNAQEAGWLLPCTVIALALLIVSRRSFARAVSGTAVLASVVWLVTVYALLSFMGNGFHTYYSDALAIPLSLVLGAAVHTVVLHSKRRSIRLLAAFGLLVTTLTGWLILGTLMEVPTTIRTAVLAAGIAAVALTAVRPPLPALNVIGAIAACGVLTGPFYADIVTISHGQTGALPISGAVASHPFSMSRLMVSLRSGEMPPGLDDLAYGRALPQSVAATLSDAPTTCAWAAATVPAQSAAVAQLAIGRPVMPLGGYQATDPSPTLEAFRLLIDQGRVCYLIDQPALDPVTTEATTSGQVIRWVRSHFESVTLDGVTVFNLRHRLP
jgi:4-amino-4-deoxy-L-arabinose transferase-like glycosyltransferase